MCSINHDLKAIYLHIPKNGGLYIEHVLNKYYNFKSYYLTHENHSLFGDEKTINNGFLHLKKDGLYKYFETSQKFNNIMDMNEDKWNSYYKFTFVRNPYTKFVSAFNYLQAGLIASESASESASETNIKQEIDINSILDKEQFGAYVYTHMCITQKEHMKDKNTHINYDFIGRFENLNEDLITILKNMGITEIKHGKYIKNSIRVNSNKIDAIYNDIYNNELLDKVNKYFEEDFNQFDYKMITDVKDIYFENNNKNDNVLYEKLLNDETITVIENIEEIKLNNGLTLDLEINNGPFKLELNNSQHKDRNNIRNIIKKEHIIDLFKTLNGKTFELKKSDDSS